MFAIEKQVQLILLGFLRLDEGAIVDSGMRGHGDHGGKHVSLVDGVTHLVDHSDFEIDWFAGGIVEPV